MILLKDGFDVRWSKFFLGIRMVVERYSDDFQVGFGLGESWILNLKSIDIVWVLDVVVDNRKVGLLGDLISDDDYSCVIWPNVVH